MSEFWCEHAWLGGKEVSAGVLIGVEGERIASVRAGAAEAPAGATVLRGYTLPGLANSHSHAFQRAIRGRTEWRDRARPKDDFWTWREQMYAAASRLDPDSYHDLARATFGEMALAGITGVGEFHYVHHGPGGVPYSDPNAMGEAVIAAAAEAGIRITLIDTCYLHGGIDAEPDETQQRFSDGTVEKWVERVEALRTRNELSTADRRGGRSADADAGSADRSDAAEAVADGPPPATGALVAAAIHSVRAVAPQEAATVAEWARSHDLPLHAHVSEQPAENEACLAAYGLTPTEVLAEAGALGEHFTGIHLTHLTERDRELLGAASATCCLCPTTERDLADGIGRGSLLREAGVRLAVGSDSQAVIDLFEECRAIELDERLATLERGIHDAGTLLAAATSDGHRAIGRPDAGRIEAGMLADLVNLDGSGVRLAGIEPRTALGSIAFAATAADVTNVIVGGEFVVRDGAHVRIDVAAELRDSIAAISDGAP